MANKNMKDALSALIDGELDEHEMQMLIREMRDDAEHKRCWEHYHIIGDALRNNLPPRIESSMVDRISQAILTEDLPLQEQLVSEQPVSEQARSNRVRTMRPMAGFAMAASVAAVAYLGFGMIALDDQAGPRLASTTPAEMASPVVPNMVAKSNPVPLGIQTVSDGHRSAVQSSLQSRLNPYLYDHRNAATTGINAWVLPRARIVVAKPKQDLDQDKDK